MKDNLLTIASYWNVHLNIYHIGPQDVAVMMALLKIARIAQNEETHIASSISQFFLLVDDIVVVDGGSTDDTKMWAERMGATRR